MGTTTCATVPVACAVCHELLGSNAALKTHMQRHKKRPADSDSVSEPNSSQQTRFASTTREAPATHDPELSSAASTLLLADDNEDDAGPPERRRWRKEPDTDLGVGFDTSSDTARVNPLPDARVAGSG